MLNAQLLLAQTTTTASNVSNPSLLELARTMKGHLDLMCQPDTLVGPLTNLNLIWSVVFVFVGGLCVFNGLRWHKTVVVVLAALGGVTAGMALGPSIGANNAIIGGAMALLLAILALPMMRYTVALLAGLSGAFAGANLWTTITTDSSQHMFGAVIGFIALGMLAFVSFRITLVAFTSIFGAVLLVLGVLSAMLKIDGMHGGLVEALQSGSRILPLITFVIAAIGLVIQHAGGFSGLNQAADRANPDKAKTQTGAAQPTSG
jgi:hypothetical protein